MVQYMVMFGGLIHVLHCVMGWLVGKDWRFMLDGVVAGVVVHGVLHYVLM